MTEQSRKIQGRTPAAPSLDTQTTQIDNRRDLSVHSA